MLGFSHLGVRRDLRAFRSPLACSRLLKRRCAIVFATVSGPVKFVRDTKIVFASRALEQCYSFCQI